MTLHPSRAASNGMDPPPAVGSKTVIPLKSVVRGLSYALSYPYRSSSSRRIGPPSTLLTRSDEAKAILSFVAAGSAAEVITGKRSVPDSIGSWIASLSAHQEI